MGKDDEQVRVMAKAKGLHNNVNYDVGDTFNVPRRLLNHPHKPSWFEEVREQRKELKEFVPVKPFPNSSTLLTGGSKPPAPDDSDIA